ncbi:hypothetical protein CEXT_41001 [Caerostris extrusa]|uniref:Uncharacterized protein n=1 Tax=Caerostris extrusa TaxID=172846 RepID=A0AAV4Q844_CAEEX|nr:hypothetical protein CEXT_41001 [Caerostris extrusa]
MGRLFKPLRKPRDSTNSSNPPISKCLVPKSDSHAFHSEIEPHNGETTISDVRYRYIHTVERPFPLSKFCSPFNYDERGGLVAWPPRSPDLYHHSSDIVLSLILFCRSDSAKSPIFLWSGEYIIIFENVRQSMHHRY